MKIFLLTISCVFLFAISASAQSACPPDRVCISPQAARKALEDGDRVIALTAELKAKEQAYTDILAELNKMRVQFAEVSGANTELRQSQVADRAVIQILVQNTKARNKYGLIVF